jgi:hypothetical protein
MLERLSKFLLGYDFFISYAYQDGQEYATALSDKLNNLDYACFFDASELVWSKNSSVLRYQHLNMRCLGHGLL